MTEEKNAKIKELLTIKNNFYFAKLGLSNSGGKTGSATSIMINELFKRTDENQNYQVKFSVLNNPRSYFLAAIRKAYGNRDSELDTENFREIIAAKIVKAVVSDARKHLVPDIDFVIDDTNPNAPNRIGITSKWLKPNNEDKNSIKTEKEEKAQCLAEFMLVGNHDCNDGNFVKVANRFGAIDYGKSFNALLNAPKQVGGRVRNTANQILDYLNREELPSTRDKTPKLWQFHENLVPSKELADAMKIISEQAKSKISEGINNAKTEFENLLMQPGIDKKHVLESLAEVANNLDGPKIKIDLEKPEVAIVAAFTRIEAFAKNQALDMEKTAKLMHAQVELDSILKEQSFDSNKLLEWSKKHNIDLNKNVTWIKASKDTPAVVGTVRDYIKASSKRLGITDQQKDKILLNTDLLPRTGFLSRIKRISLLSSERRSSFFERGSSITSRDSFTLTEKEAKSLREDLNRSHSSEKSSSITSQDSLKHTEKEAKSSRNTSQESPKAQSLKRKFQLQQKDLTLPPRRISTINPRSQNVITN